MNRSYLKIKEKFFQNKKGVTTNMGSKYTEIKKDYYCTNQSNEIVIHNYDNLDNHDNHDLVENIIVDENTHLDDQLLYRLFDLFDNGAHKTYTIYICILVSGIFLMEKSDTGFSFPHFSYQCPELPENEKDEEYSPENIHFSNACIQYAVDILNLEIHSQDTDLATFYTLERHSSFGGVSQFKCSSVYKGFLPYDENTIFAFFDFTPFSNKIEKKWFGTMDDIVVHKSINRIPVDPVITNFFVENLFFMT